MKRRPQSGKGILASTFAGTKLEDDGWSPPHNGREGLIGDILETSMDWFISKPLPTEKKEDQAREKSTTGSACNGFACHVLLVEVPPSRFFFQFEGTSWPVTTHLSSQTPPLVFRDSSGVWQMFFISTDAAVGNPTCLR